MIAIIPARGGSKGLPRKNIKCLLGKPLIAYTIEEALKSKSISRVIISTGDLEIAEISKKYGAEVPFMRPEYLSSDISKAIDTYIYTIQKIEEQEQININEFIVLLPTSPLRECHDIDAACGLFYDKHADSVISYTKEHHPISWHKFVNDDGKFEDIFQDNLLKNRQELKESFFPNGSIYVFSKKIILEGRYYSDNSYSYIMPRERSVDIDTYEDFELAEFYLKKKNEKQTHL